MTFRLHMALLRLSLSLSIGCILTWSACGDTCAVSPGKNRAFYFIRRNLFILRCADFAFLLGLKTGNWLISLQRQKLRYVNAKTDNLRHDHPKQRRYGHVQ